MPPILDPDKYLPLSLAIVVVVIGILHQTFGEYHIGGAVTLLTYWGLVRILKYLKPR